MYTVFNHCILTDNGKTIVRKHAAKMDAQKAYVDLLAHAKSSTAAEVSADGMLGFITTAKSDSTWNGTTEGFLLHWAEQVHKYNELIPVNDIFPDNVLKCMIQSAVSPIPALRTVRELEDQHQKAGSSLFTYQEYMQLLISAAQRYETQANMGRTRCSRCAINVHDMSDNQFDDYVDDCLRQACDMHSFAVS